MWILGCDAWIIIFGFHFDMMANFGFSEGMDKVVESICPDLNVNLLDRLQYDAQALSQIENLAQQTLDEAGNFSVGDSEKWLIAFWSSLASNWFVSSPIVILGMALVSILIWQEKPYPDPKEHVKKIFDKKKKLYFTEHQIIFNPYFIIQCFDRYLIERDRRKIFDEPKEEWAKQVFQAIGISCRKNIDK